MTVAPVALAILAVSAVFVVLGLGGGILFVPILHWAGYDLQAVAIPLGLLLNGTNTLLALAPYGREGLVDWRGGAPMALAAAATAPLGALIQPRVDPGILIVLFAAAVSLAAIRALRGARGKPGASPAPAPRAAWIAPAVGAGVGLAGGVLGIGAGFIVAPALMAMGHPPRRAAATTALVVTVCSFAGVVGYLPHGEFPLGITLAGLVAVAVGSRIGARFMLRGAKPAWIARGYALVLAAVAIKLLWDAAARLAS